MRHYLAARTPGLDFVARMRRSGQTWSVGMIHSSLDGGVAWSGDHVGDAVGDVDATRPAMELMSTVSFG